ncbi:MAG: chaperone modulator CbpM [Flavisolibacter sp.]|jgi:uncharacterized protein YlbG (UPF0298 family)
MQTPKLIPASEFCQHHEIEVSFLQSLDEFGLITITSREESLYIDEDEMNEIEKMIRLHYDLNINLEGIDAITQILKRMETLHNELTQLKTKLALFEK